MNTKRRSIAFRVIGAVVASFLAFGITAGPADAATSSGKQVVARDTGW